MSVDTEDVSKYFVDSVGNEVRSIGTIVRFVDEVCSVDEERSSKSVVEGLPVMVSSEVVSVMVLVTVGSVSKMVVRSEEGDVMEVVIFGTRIGGENTVGIVDSAVLLEVIMVVEVDVVDVADVVDVIDVDVVDIVDVVDADELLSVEGGTKISVVIWAVLVVLLSTGLNHDGLT